MKLDGIYLFCCYGIEEISFYYELGNVKNKWQQSNFKVVYRLKFPIYVIFWNIHRPCPYSDFINIRMFLKHKSNLRNPYQNPGNPA